MASTETASNDPIRNLTAHTSPKYPKFTYSRYFNISARQTVHTQLLWEPQLVFCYVIWASVRQFCVVASPAIWQWSVELESSV